MIISGLNCMTLIYLVVYGGEPYQKVSQNEYMWHGLMLLSLILRYQETFDVQVYQMEDWPHRFRWMDIIAGVIMMVWDYMIGLLSHF